MAKFDCFNGDADGICALIQFRNAFPAESSLVTGVKRDIKLVQKIDVSEGDDILVLDIAFEKNAGAVEKALGLGASVLYFDHHFPGDLLEHPNLKTYINTASDTCTAILVNRYLKGQFVEWAIVGAFGDNLFKSAESLANSVNLPSEQVEQLKRLGTYINYNGYGATEQDLHFAPAELYSLMVKYQSPFQFMFEDTETFSKLEAGYIEDMASAQSIKPFHQERLTAAFIFPDAPWARRVSGVYSNDLANASPDRAHAVLTEKANSCYLVSVRAPLNNKSGADELCLGFPTGGGRKAAAGINDLPADMLDDFIAAFVKQFA